MPLINIKEKNQKLIEIWEKIDLNKEFNDFKSVTDEAGQKSPIKIPFLAPGIITDDINKMHGGLIVIGLNPSYSSTGWLDILKSVDTGLLKGHESKFLVDLAIEIKCSNTLKKIQKEEKIIEFNERIDKFFTYSGALCKDWMEDVSIFESNSFNNHPYFKKMRELAQHVYDSPTPNWCHIDLFFYRKTSQAELKKLIGIIDNSIKDEVNMEEYNPDKRITDSYFFNLQLAVIKDIIIELKPKIILISNAYAGEIFKKMFYPSSELNIKIKAKFPDLDKICQQYLEYNKTDSQTRIIEKGSIISLTKHQIEDIYDLYFLNEFFNKNENGAFDMPIWDDKVKTSVFFSGMLSGQRALDLGSYERLKWHMKAVKYGKTMKLHSQKHKLETL